MSSSADVPDADLDALVEAVRASRKYRHVCTELIRNIGRHQLASQPNYKSALKATKSKLHQVGSAYMPGQAHYARWLDELDSTDDQQERQALCERIMTQHASSRERLPVLCDIYAQMARYIAPPRSIMDIACGFNPLSAPWMPLAPATTYHLYDIYDDLVGFLCAALPRLGVNAQGASLDVTQSVPEEPVDLVLLMKAIPCLEQLDREAGQRLLEQAPSEKLLVTFPVRSLGGRAKGMEASYAQHFEQLTDRPGWHSTRLDVTGELVYLLERPWSPRASAKS